MSQPDHYRSTSTIPTFHSHRSLIEPTPEKDRIDRKMRKVFGDRLIPANSLQILEANLPNLNKKQSIDNYS